MKLMVTGGRGYGVLDPRKRYSLSQGVLVTFNVKYPPVGSGHKVSQEMVQ